MGYVLWSQSQEGHCSSEVMVKLQKNWDCHVGEKKWAGRLESVAVRIVVAEFVVNLGPIETFQVQGHRS